MMLTRALMPLLSTDSKVVAISSQLGSISQAADFKDVQLYSYNASKAALNMLVAQLANHFKDTSIGFYSIHPGYVKTDLNNQQGVTPVEESVGDMIESISKLTLKQSGGFFGPKGNVLPF
jgi:NAD(P)-dependent dehydrogenase (short-subunit alcohol dehydrogenase family)